MLSIAASRSCLRQPADILDRHQHTTYQEYGGMLDLSLCSTWQQSMAG